MKNIVIAVTSHLSQLSCDDWEARPKQPGNVEALLLDAAATMATWPQEFTTSS
jgi:hypothetical protein